MEEAEANKYLYSPCALANIAFIDNDSTSIVSMREFLIDGLRLCFFIQLHHNIILESSAERRTG